MDEPFPKSMRPFKPLKSAEKFKPQFDLPALRNLSSSGSNLAESPSPDARAQFTFDTPECLQSPEQNQLIKEQDDNLQASGSPLLSRARTNALSQSLSRDADCLFYRAAPTFGRSRRMSQSLPELRDCQFVSVLPDLEEEESENSEFQAGGEDVNYEKPTIRTQPRHRKLDFLFCSVCQALGLCNFWRFPYYCYSNGGGTFMFAYLVLLFLCGVPLLCMEFAIGQLTQSGPISALGQLCPLMKGIGIASMMISFWLTGYYSVLVSWTLFYTFNSFYSPPRWTRCMNTWNSELCHDGETSLRELLPSSNSTTNVTHTASTDVFLPVTEISLPSVTIKSLDLYDNASDGSFNIQNYTHPAVEFANLKMLDTSHGIDESGELRFELLAAVMFVWVLIYIALRKTDFFRGTTIYILTIISHLLLFSIFLRTIALEGAKNGLQFMFKPEWNQMTNPRVWLYALAQAFHSLGVVLGPSILMGSCHKPHNNLLRDTIVLTSVNVVTVILIGCVAFGTLGHVALKLGKPLNSVLVDDPSTVFVLYSIVIGSMPVPSCWGVLFFLVFLCLGLDSQIKLMATLVSAFKESYTYYIKQRFLGHSLFLAVICGVCFLATIPYLTQAGIYFFQLIDHYVAVLAVSVVALLEICTLGWLYGSANLSTSIQQMTGKTPSCYFRLSWSLLSPLSILAIMIYSIITLTGSVVRKGYVYPSWAHAVGWAAFAMTLCWVPVLAIAAYRKAPKSNLFCRLSYMIQPNIRSYSDSMWEPKPMIIMNGSTVNESEFPDYKVPELPSSANSVHSYIMDRQAGLHRQHETNF